MKQQDWDHFMQKHDPYINKVHRCNFVKSYVSTFNSEEFTLKTPKKSPNRQASAEKLDLIQEKRGIIENTFRERIINSIAKWKDIKVKVSL